jgi:hypothetical protein
MTEPTAPLAEPRQIITYPGQKLTPDEIAEITKRGLLDQEKSILVEEYKNRELTPEDHSFLADYAGMSIRKKAKILDIPAKRLKELLKRDKEILKCSSKQ